MAIIYRLDRSGDFNLAERIRIGAVYTYVGNIKGGFVYEDSGIPEEGKGTYVGNVGDAAGARAMIYRDSGAPQRGKGDVYGSIRVTVSTLRGRSVLVYSEGRYVEHECVLEIGSDNEIFYNMEDYASRIGKGHGGSADEIAAAAYLLLRHLLQKMRSASVTDGGRAFVVECPNCGKMFNVAPKLAGKKADCDGCGNAFQAGPSGQPKRKWWQFWKA